VALVWLSRTVARPVVVVARAGVCVRLLGFSLSDLLVRSSHSLNVCLTRVPDPVLPPTTTPATIVRESIRIN
jgi:hypothetical protein